MKIKIFSIIVELKIMRSKVMLEHM